MKYILLLTIFTLTLISCNSTAETKNVEEVNSPKIETGKKFFDYDEIVYYFNDYDESKLSDLYGNQSTSVNDSFKKGIILGKIPKDITDLDFINKLEKFGYKKSIIDKSKFNEIDNIFVEKTNTNNVFSACIYVYRDILIFKKQGKVIGTAKICFGCMANEITGTNANTENFGQEGDYYILEKLLRK